MTNTKYEFGIASDLKKFGVTEDGEDFVGDVYYLIATDKAGNRFVHREAFDGCHIHNREDGPCFMDIRSDAHAAAEALLKQIIAASPSELDINDWQKTRPVYGSFAHNESDLVAFERERSPNWEPTGPNASP